MAKNTSMPTTSKTKSSKPTKQKTKETVFVIMPFGGWGDDYYETIYRPAIEASNLDAHRADDLFRPSTIVNDIWAYTKKARLLLADLSGKNPNVFYELGLAHALAKPVILVAESMEEVPFDLRALRVITYDKHDPEWGRNLREKVEASVKEVLQSPLDAVLPAFLDVKGAPSKPQVTAHEKELIEIKQELDLVKREMRSGSRFDRPERMINKGGDRIDSEEALRRIARYIELKMPSKIIIERLTRLGAPSVWVEDQIENIRKMSRPHKADPSKTVTE